LLRCHNEITRDSAVKSFVYGSNRKIFGKEKMGKMGRRCRQEKKEEGGEKEKEEEEKMLEVRGERKYD